MLSRIQWLCRLALLAGVLIPLGSAHAWKPYTHNFAASESLKGVNFARHEVTINGQAYPVDPRVTDAIQACPSCYHAGVVGPDGLPDLAFGQTVIHSKKVGMWMRELLKAAWKAQSRPDYSEQEKKQILAFTYGYLTHAAGDFWAHTVVNELSHDVFPTLEEILQSPSRAGISLRHTILEATIGDATPGYDGNPERSIAPGGYGQTQGDVSTKSTPGSEYQIPPSRFIYEAMIKETQLSDVHDIAARPGNFINARGPLLGGFFELRHYMRTHLNSPMPQPLREALDAYGDTAAAFMALEEACDFDAIEDIESCGAGLLMLGYVVVIDSAQAFWTFVTAELEVLARAVLDGYLVAWVAEISTGFLHWSELGLAATQGMFDAQAFRDVQNQKCMLYGQESLPPAPPNLRDRCEESVGTLTVLLAKTNPFINQYGLRMLGLPGFVGEVREAVGQIELEFQIMLVDMGLSFNPLDPLVRLDYAFEELIQDTISEALLIDVEALGEFLTHPSQYMCLEQGQFSLPYLGQVDIPLFTSQEHARLDDYLGLSGTPHHIQEVGLPLACGRLQDTAEFDPQAVSAIRDLITMGRLILLNGDQLNRALGGVLGRRIQTYRDQADFPANIMVDALVGDPIHPATPDEPYLWSIDTDHGWRQDGWPVFPVVRPDDKKSGSGRFPVWESCALRPAFRTLFRDWENPWDQRAPLPGMPLDNFPEGSLAFRDLPSEDTLNDPAPPQSNVQPDKGFQEGGIYYVPESHAFWLTATDRPTTQAFPVSELGIQYQIRHASLPAPGWTTVLSGVFFAVGGPDGRYFIDHRSSDPCHTFDESVGRPEPVKTAEVVLDTTAPVTACLTPPFGQVFETDGTSSANFTVEDPGAGVASFSATIDGMVDAGGPVPVGQGAPIDMFNLLPGVRTVTVTATDRLSHTSTTACTFELRVSSKSLGNNLERFYLSGQIEGTLYHALRVKLMEAQRAHLLGSHKTEVNVISAFTHQLEAQRGKKISEKAASQLLIYARDLIARGG